MTDNEHPDRYEVKTISHHIIGSEDEHDTEIARLLNDGWELLNLTVVAATPGYGSPLRIVTLQRETEAFKQWQHEIIQKSIDDIRAGWAKPIWEIP